MRPGALARRQYATSLLHLTKLVLKRQFLLNARDRAFYVARAVQVGGASYPHTRPAGACRCVQVRAGACRCVSIIPTHLSLI